MQVSYDFHIHTAASPCGDEQMTPNNIVNMAKLLEKHMIAITDHNTCANCEAVMNVAKNEGIIVIPGMEIECMEEFHLIALFPSLEVAKTIEAFVQEHMPPIANKVKIFGQQQILDEEDEVKGEIDRLLLTATKVSVYELYKRVTEVGGILIPAHIDRNSYSILSNLGIVPEDIPFTTLEVSHQVDFETYKETYGNYQIIRGSDAHYLEDLCKENQYLEIDLLSKKNIFRKLLKI